MSRPVIFSAASKGAFRVEVLGRDPSSVASFLLTGHGDEHDLLLTKGHYSANVTNIATGVRDSLDFVVDDAAGDTVIPVGADNRPRLSNWRSVAGEAKRVGRAKGVWRDAAALDGPPRAAEPAVRLRVRTPKGFRAFAGSCLINADAPRTLKIVRSGSWATNPVLQMDFQTCGGAAVNCLIPLFSGGTLARWDKNWQLTELIPCEPKSAALVGGLSRSLRHEMPAVLHWAASGTREDPMRALLARDDPWAAVAVGLLLIASGSGKDIGSWSLRYASRYAWLSDFALLGAWWHAASKPDDEAACLALLKQARKNGHLYFWNSFQLAEQLLVALSGGANSPALRAEARSELRRWGPRRAGALKAGAFPSWCTHQPHQP